jgi:hypothetical protein
MRNVIYLFVVFALLGLPPAIAAQPSYGSSQPATGESSYAFLSSTFDARTMGCAINLSRDRVEYFLQNGNTPNRSRQQKAFDALGPVLQACLDGRSTTFNTNELRGGLAYMLLTENNGALAARAASLPAGEPTWLETTKDKVGPQMACIAAREPSLTFSYLKTAPGSNEEQYVSEQLRETTRACSVSGKPAEISPHFYRLWLAYETYLRVRFYAPS